jgi:hypothetical protein
MNYFITKDHKLVLGQEAPASFVIKGKNLKITQQEGYVINLDRVK